jgi:Holliday junction resolvase RusA-like endonuclease
MRKVNEEMIMLYLPNWNQYDKPVIIEFDFYEKDERRDVDNVAGVAHKFILDSLVMKGILKDDSQKYVKGFVDKFHVDKKNPRIEVSIKEI